MRILLPVVANFIFGLLLLPFLDGQFNYPTKIAAKTYAGSQHGRIPGKFSAQNTTVSILHRKLLNYGTRADDECSEKDIMISQGMTGRQPDGIPIYAVQITNLCAAGCPIANIHLTCGWFSSATLINPKLFKRLAYDDCLVNNEQPLAAGLTIAFTYSTNFMYPLAVSSATINC